MGIGVDKPAPPPPVPVAPPAVPVASPVPKKKTDGEGADLEAALLELEKELPDVPDEPAAPPPAAGGGPAVYSVILPQIRSEKKRGEAALIISQVMGIPEEKALSLTNRVIITVARDLTEARAEQVKATFEEKGFKARVTKKK